LIDTPEEFWDDDRYVRKAWSLFETTIFVGPLAHASNNGVFFRYRLGRRFESAYEAALKYFEVNKRLTLVNNRLNMIGELHSVLAEENASTHASQLEASSNCCYVDSLSLLGQSFTPTYTFLCAKTMTTTVDCDSLDWYVASKTCVRRDTCSAVSHFVCACFLPSDLIGKHKLLRLCWTYFTLGFTEESHLLHFQSNKIGLFNSR